MPQRNLYFIAIIPPEVVSAEVTGFRNDFKDNYNSKAALKNMPHITLKAPFKTDASHHTNVVIWFKELPIAKGAFEIELNDFGAFNSPKNPVVYVRPVVTTALLGLQQGVIVGFENAFPNIPLHFHEHTFNPHMTIAYRDLAYAEFKKAWEVYSTMKYNAKFKVTGFYLLQHNGTEWKAIAEHTID